MDSAKSRNFYYFCVSMNFVTDSLRMTRKEILIGVFVALCATILLNYIAFERILIDGISFWNNALNNMCFSLVWYGLLSFVMYSYFIVSFNFAEKRVNKFVAFVGVVTGAIIVSYHISELYPTIKDLFVESRPLRGRLVKTAIRGELSTTLSKHLLVSLLNLLLVYSLRMIYTNQQLQIEKVKAEHNALLQQINPHFFFNSLNGLNYLIVKEGNKEAKAYLDNLTSVFRQILKHNDKNVYALSQEVEFIRFYIYILNQRFGDSFKVEINLAPESEAKKIARLSLMTLIENVVKHNTINEEQDLILKIYSTDDNYLVIENNIIERFDTVKSSGIGLDNLKKQYALLNSREIIVSKSENMFTVKLPLL